MDEDDDSIFSFFDSIIDDKNEKKIMKLILENKTPEEIVEILVRGV